MKFFHISDLHLGLKLVKRDLIEDQRYILNQIIEEAKKEKLDALVIAGDIFDKAIPSAEAISIFDDFIGGLREGLPNLIIMAISGNHDSAQRTNLFRNILSERNFYMIGLPPMKEGEHIEKVSITDEFGEVHFYLLPFVNPSMCRGVFLLEEGERLSYDETLHRLIEREKIDEKDRNVFVSHQFYIPAGSSAEDAERMDSEVLMVGNIDAIIGDFLTKFDYAALGHIHKPMKVGGEYFRYSGTPLACSVSEAGQQKGIILVEMAEKGRVETKVLPLKPLREVKKLKDEFNKIKPMASDDYVSITLTDEGSLDKIGMNAELRSLFPNLLDYSFENKESPNYVAVEEKIQSQDAYTPLELCKLFLSDMSEEEMSFLSTILNEVNEGVAR